MPQPNKSQVHIDVPLTNISIAFSQDESGFIANKIFPVVPVRKSSDRYYVYPRGAWNRNEMKKRAPSTESAGSGWTLSDDSYLCDVYALHKDIDWQTEVDADEQFNLQVEATEFLSLKSLINREVSFMSQYFTTSVWAEDVNVQTDADFGSQPFSNSASTPIKGVRAARTRFALRTGLKANAIAIAKKTWDALMDNDDFLSRVIGGASNDNPAEVNRQLIAAFFEVDEVHVAEGLVNNAAEAVTETEDNAFIADEGMLLYYKPRRVSLRSAAAGLTFAWNAYTGTMDGMGIRRFDMEAIRSERIEIEDAFDQKQVSVDLGTFIHNTI